MYNGDEKLINTGAYMSYTMLDFWRWAYSNILHNMQRGTFADFIVKCALDSGGVMTRQEIGTGLEPYDLEGPVILSTGKVSRIEVKSTAFVQTWDIKHPNRANFSIAPAKAPDETGDYPRLAGRQRNNDIYVFALYTATDRKCNILDLSWWKFYVYPTYKIDESPTLSKQKTISLARLEKIGIEPCKFDSLCDIIKETISDISDHFNEKSCP
jgi:hypothetical protein